MADTTTIKYCGDCKRTDLTPTKGGKYRPHDKRHGRVRYGKPSPCPNTTGERTKEHKNAPAPKCSLCGEVVEKGDVFYVLRPVHGYHRGPGGIVYFMMQGVKPEGCIHKACVKAVRQKACVKAVRQRLMKRVSNLVKEDE